MYFLFQKDKYDYNLSAYFLVFFTFVWQMYTYQRIDIVETHLKKAIANACTETKAMLENQQAEMERYVQRLATVRQEKECTRKMLLMQGLFSFYTLGS